MDKSLIKLREKRLSSGNTSLYLDYYKDGIRTYEFLKLYILPGNDALTRAKNKSTYHTARTIQAQRILDIQQGRASMLTAERKSQRFVDYYREFLDTKTASTTYKLFRNALPHWIAYKGENVTLEMIDIRMMTGFTRHLLKTKAKNTGRPMSETTARKYFDCICKVLDRAVRDGILSSNPARSLEANEKPQGMSAEREFLTMDEVRRLADTECRNEMMKKAFLFSCFTGLRKSDIIRLTWDNIEGRELVIRMKKTKDIIYLPLSDNALSCLPERKDEKVFHLYSDRQVAKDIKRWMREAKIRKHITFHCARHTFATLALTYGADLYTVSKLLGHRNIQTTQIYARIVDSKKKEAVSLIPTL